MILPLRRRHRRMILALALVLPALYVGALAARPSPPPALPLTGVVSGAPPLGASLAGQWPDLWMGLPITTRLLVAPDLGRWVEIAPRRDLEVPGPLLYWHPGPAAGGGLPPDAVLLGPLAAGAPRAFRLPLEAAGGELLLWSLEHGELVGRATLPPAGATAEGAARRGSGHPREGGVGA